MTMKKLNLVMLTATLLFIIFSCGEQQRNDRDDDEMRDTMYYEQDVPPRDTILPIDSAEVRTDTSLIP